MALTSETGPRACRPNGQRGARQTVRVTASRYRALSDEQWKRIEPLLPANAGRRGHPFSDNRGVIEEVIYRSRTGSRCVICHAKSSDRGGQSGSGNAGMPATGRRTRSWPVCGPRRSPPIRSTGTCRRTRRPTVHISTARTRPARTRTQGRRRITRRPRLGSSTTRSRVSASLPVTTSGTHAAG
ncbi:transposase [Amycolatopsis sp. cmx-11-12]|uniref:transposase n=1 Tax=Amycolatopsis sp. cmx-11-12 TaxID=2785795 RepID=UPI003916ED72